MYKKTSPWLQGDFLCARVSGGRFQSVISTEETPELWLEFIPHGSHLQGKRKVTSPDPHISISALKNPELFSSGNTKLPRSNPRNPLELFLSRNLNIKDRGADKSILPKTSERFTCSCEIIKSYKMRGFLFTRATTCIASFVGL